MTIESIKHKNATRVHIPSKEEAGTEEASPKVQEKTKAGYPKNPIVHRGQDPELFWLHKYGADELDDSLTVDIRSLYRHEHISPEVLIKKLYELKEVKGAQTNLFDINELFGHTLHTDELEKVSEYYKHQDGWSNRLIQGDSLLVMTSLLEREGMAGKVQMVYFDPPYGIKYGSNWQMKLNNREVKDGSDEALTGEPEQIRAYRDTWELGIHSYLSYLRDRLLVARDLLTESGSCFVQISDENVHLVRNIMDEVFGSENFVSLITYQTSVSAGSRTLDKVCDYIIWYAKNKELIKYRNLYLPLEVGEEGATRYNYIDLPNGKTRLATDEEIENYRLGKSNYKLFTDQGLTSRGETKSANTMGTFEFDGEKYTPPAGHWRTGVEGLKNLSKIGRILKAGTTIRFKKYFDDFPFKSIANCWTDTGGGIQSRLDPKVYVVQTTNKAIFRCLLMTTDPGDLILDPTCGSGTTAYVAEQWGRRWITVDTSRIALNIAKTRLMTAVYPYYKLYDDKSNDIRQGFIYKKVPHITLKSLANDNPPEEETLFDRPEEDRKILRVSGPFTVETLQSFEPVSPESLDSAVPDKDENENFEARIFEHLKSAGVKNGIKNENAVFIRVERLSSAYLHAEGFYTTTKGEKKAYLHIGPKFGTVSKQAVNEAVKECRNRGDADWLIILGFSFESNISNESITTSIGSFEVTKARMHDDLLQEGLLKKDKKAGSFITIGEPDIKLHKKGKTATVELLGIDIYDPIKDEVKGRSVADIAYWMVDDDYDGSNFVLRQVFFCGGDKDEFEKWQKGLSELAKIATKTNAEKTLRIEIDNEAFDRLYGHKSHPIEIKNKNQKIAVRVISQFGEEVMKVLEL
jgi:adenine-specific DNA-methyltransferase